MEFEKKKNLNIFTMIEFVVLCMGRFFFSSNFILPKELDVGKIEIRKLIFTIDGAILQ
jgi:hypothetical protein